MGCHQADAASPQTTLPSSSSRRSGYGCALKSPRPNQAANNKGLPGSGDLRYSVTELLISRLMNLQAPSHISVRRGSLFGITGSKPTGCQLSLLHDADGSSEAAMAYPMGESESQLLRPDFVPCGLPGYSENRYRLTQFTVHPGNPGLCFCSVIEQPAVTLQSDQGET
jgi:hypothetical protein